MPSPVLPEQFKATIPPGTGDFCGVFENWLEFRKLFSQFFDWMHSEDGKLSADFFAQYGIYGTGVNAAIPPRVVYGVSATDTMGGYIDLQWDPVPGATSYKVYRNTVDDTVTATWINQATTTYVPKYADRTVGLAQGTTYYYWVKATNAAGDSESFSVVTTGIWPLGTTQDWTELTVGKYSIVVPAGKTSVYLHCWAAGGLGGEGGTHTNVTGDSKKGWVETVMPLIGGGGGSGAYGRIDNYTVAPGDTITVKVGPGGTTANGRQGGDTTVGHKPVTGDIVGLITIRGGGYGGPSGLGSGGPFLGVQFGAPGAGGKYYYHGQGSLVNGVNGVGASLPPFL